MNFGDLLQDVQISSVLFAISALVALFVTKRSATRQSAHAINEEVDASVLLQFKELMDRISNLEKDLAEAKRDLAEALAQIKELRNLEEYLQARLHEKDKELAEATKARYELQRELDHTVERLKELEENCV